MTRATDPATGDYLDLADDLREVDIGDYPRTVRELWRRVAVSIAIRNTDDHLRNHGFLHASDGWGLAPAFDITPNPIDGAERTTAIDGEASPVREARALGALGVAFRIPVAEQLAGLDAVLASAGSWRTRAAALGLPDREVRLLEPALDAAQSRLAAERDRLA